MLRFLNELNINCRLLIEERRNLYVILCDHDLLSILQNILSQKDAIITTLNGKGTNKGNNQVLECGNKSSSVIKEGSTTSQESSNNEKPLEYGAPILPNILAYAAEILTNCVMSLPRIYIYIYIYIYRTSQGLLSITRY